VPLADALASPERKRRYNRRLFTTIAPRYDLITRLLSYGRDQHWKARLVALAGIAPGERALDVACGTGDIALRLQALGAEVVGLDLTPAMLLLAKRRPGAARVAYLAGDIGALPFRDATIDVVTAGYALRNVADLDAGIRELARVVRPGGRLLALDFNRPAFPPVRLAYEAYLWVVGSILGLALHRDPDTYRYIAASLRRYPGAAGVAHRLRGAGFTDTVWYPVLGGLMALHVAKK
jgi:demethylmenaquinone methyltransferase/2-methoxy-6-polyprenyl-1,4-benzoquinol methylase